MEHERAAEIIAELTADALAEQREAVQAMVEAMTGPALARLAELEARATLADDRAAAAEARAVAAEAAAADALAIAAEAATAATARAASEAGAVRAAVRDAIESLADRVNATEAESRRIKEGQADFIQAFDIFGMREEIAAETAELTERVLLLEAIDPEPGPPGEPGLDRPVIDMIAEWSDETTRLDKGVLLCEGGSLFLATREAHGPPSDEPSSWHPLAKGCQIEGADYDGERGLCWQIRSGHDRYEIAIGLPLPVHRGLWDPATDYAAHDLVTWDGAVWRCLANFGGDSLPPDVPESGWSMFLPRGKTGRPGKDGLRGVPGPEGRGIANVFEAIIDNRLAFEMSDGTIATVDLSPLLEARPGGAP